MSDQDIDLGLEVWCWWKRGYYSDHISQSQCPATAWMESQPSTQKATTEDIKQQSGSTTKPSNQKQIFNLKPSLTYNLTTSAWMESQPSIQKTSEDS